MLTHWCISIELALHLLAEILCLHHRNSYLGIWGYYWVGWDLNRTISTVLSITHLSFNVICIIANVNLFGILVNLPSSVEYLADCSLYVVKDWSPQLSVSSYARWITTWSWRCPALSFSVLCSHRFKIIDCLSLSRIPFQGLPLLGNLHSLDITRRIGSLICSSLTLNVIHSGQLEAWTFFVRETSLTKSFNQTTQKQLVKVLHGKHRRRSMLWSTQEICVHEALFMFGNG